MTDFELSPKATKLLANSLSRSVRCLICSVPLMLAACGGSSGNNGAASNGGNGNPTGTPTGSTVTTPLGTVPAVATQIKLLAGQIGGSGYIDGPAPDAKFELLNVLTIDDAGNIYVMDIINNNLRKISSSGQVSTLAGRYKEPGCDNGLGSAATFWGFNDMVAGNGSDIYGTDSSCNSIRKISSSGLVSTIAGGVGSDQDVDGVGSSAGFAMPSGIAFDKGSGILYVADQGHGIIDSVPRSGSTVRKITPDGVVTTLAGQSGHYGYVDGPGNSAQFNQPTDIVIDRSGNLFVNDSNNQAIRKIDVNGVVSTFVPPSSGLLNKARLRLDSDGNLVILDTVSGITRVSPTAPGIYFGQISASTLAGLFISQPPSLGPYLNGRFDAAGNWLTPLSGVVQKMSPSLTVSTIAGSLANSGVADGTGASAAFIRPNGPALDQSGNVYVIDDYPSSLRKITPAGVVTTITPSSFHFSGTSKPVADAKGNIYVINGVGGVSGEMGLLSILKITPAGEVMTIRSETQSLMRRLAVDGAGNLYVSYVDSIKKMSPSGDLTPYISLGSDNVIDFAVDNQGNVYGIDSLNYVVRKITPQGQSTVLAGQPGVAGYKDGLASTANFTDLRRIAVDDAANVFVGDGNTIRRITPQGVVSTFVGVMNQRGTLLGAAPGSIGKGDFSIHDGRLYLVSDNAVVIVSGQ